MPQLNISAEGGKRNLVDTTSEFVSLFYGDACTQLTSCSTVVEIDRKSKILILIVVLMDRGLMVANFFAFF